MMVWSDAPKEGFLTREGIAAMRSKLTNTIFRDEMLQIYERKDVAYKELIEAAQDTMRELIQKMEHQLCDNPSSRTDAPAGAGAGNYHRESSMAI